MSGKILIIDPVSTNRIVLRVKMLAAQYAVRTVERIEDAPEEVAQFQPDLILTNLSATGAPGTAFCKALRQEAETRGIAQVGVGGPLSGPARLAALAAGVDDILPAPINDALLMARVRSLLRQRSVLSDLIDADGVAARHFGFGEARGQIVAPPRVALLGTPKLAGQALAQNLQTALRQPVKLSRTIRELALGPAPDVIVVANAQNAHSVVGLSETISDLRARDVTSQAAQLVIVPRWAGHQAAMALDLAADDIAFDDTPPEELALRALRLARRKGQADALRAELKAGLRAAITDTLTGLHNRHYADSFMQRLQQSASLCGQSYAMILLDIDHFKAINDCHGHDAGDKVLAEMGRRLRHAAASADLCARIGGEEFLIVASSASMSGGRLLAEDLRRAVSDEPFQLGHLALPVTISAGVAVYDPLSGVCTADTGPLGPLYAQADAALYRAKSAGRDAVSCAQSAAA